MGKIFYIGILYMAFQISPMRLFSEIRFSEERVVFQSDLISPIRTHIADLNSDGIADVLVYCEHDDQLYWYPGTGDSTCWEASRLIELDEIDLIKILTADLDGDEDQDLIFQHYLKITWCSNDGHGSFGSQVIIADVKAVHESIQLVDFDQDHDWDVVCLIDSGQSIVWFENLNGRGQFSDYQIVMEQNSPPYQFQISDMDDDESMDIVCIESNDIVWYESEQMSNRHIAVGLDTSITWFKAVNKGDVIDIFLLADRIFSPWENIKEMRWYRKSQMNSEFDYMSRFSERNPRFYRGAEVYDAVDFDGDADLDVVFKLYDHEDYDPESSVCVLVNNFPDTIFTYLSMPFLDVNPTHYCLGDLDGDQDMDVVFCRNRQNRLAWLKNNSGSELSMMPNLNDALVQYPHVGVYDVDHDNDRDVVAGGYQYDLVTWYENLDGLGTFGEKQKVTHFNESYSHHVLAADVNGDNLGDIMEYGSGMEHDYIRLYKQISPGEFDDGTYIDDGGWGREIWTLSGVRAVDLDGDQDLDVLVSAEWQELVAWYQNVDGQGNFGSQIVIDDQSFHAFNGREYQDVHAADFDGDGDNDVVGFAEGTIYFFENTDGRGCFEESYQASNYEYELGKICPGDIDGDGDMDIICPSGRWECDENEQYGRVVWLENVSSDSGFSFRQRYQDMNADDPEYMLETCDLDNDGDVDYLTEAGWFENIDGKGTFASAVGSGSCQIGAVGDINGDGKVDLIQRAKEGIFWCENQTSVHSDVNTLSDIALNLYSCYPNPFNPTTTIPYSVSQSATVRLTIYNVLGKSVRMLVSKNQPAGTYQVQWDGRNDSGQRVSSGIFIVEMRAGEFIKRQKMMLLR